MRKILFLTPILFIIIISPILAYYSANFVQASDTVGWVSTCDYGTASIGWGVGGYLGNNCMYIYVNKTSTTSGNAYLNYTSPSFTLGVDTIWSFYAALSSSASFPSIYTQGYSQQGASWTWANPGYDGATAGSGPPPTGFTGGISTTWQRFTLYRNDTTLGTPMDEIGIQFVLGTNTGIFIFKIDNALFGPSLNFGPVVINSTYLPNGSMNYPYSQTLQANNGVPPYSWSTVSGLLPPGLSLYNSTGVISGTPSALGIYNFTVEVTDSVSSSVTQALSITISQISVNYTISPLLDQSTISPYIYGTNQKMFGGENFTLYRLGGNEMTPYNWVNNDTNDGSDWFQNSGSLANSFGISGSAATTAGSVLTTFFEQSTTANAKCILTVPMAGYVASDDTGIVSLAQTAPSYRWDQVVNQKGSPFSLTPTLSTNSVFVDEEVNFLVNKYGLAQNGGIMGYDLDNEPSIWPGTHPRIHPTQTCCTELVQKTIACSTTVKSVDSTALIFGPVEYGFVGYLSLQNAPDWASVSTGYSPNWFLSYYLDTVHKASVSYGQRLLDVMDLHCYTSATDAEGNAINATSAVNDTISDKLVRLQAPRTLWDKNYIEPSWIAQWEDQYLPFIPTMQTTINTYYPGTKLSFTEYNYGGAWDITGGIAQADSLGIYGKYGLYAATYFALNGPETYTSLAFKMFRNYDGNNSTFGNIHVQALMNDTTDTSIYASVTAATISSQAQLHIIVLNKTLTQPVYGNFTINSPTLFQSGKVYLVSSDSTSITGPVSFTITNNSFTYNPPPLSITHLILTTTPLEIPGWEKYY